MKCLVCQLDKDIKDLNQDSKCRDRKTCNRINWVRLNRDKALFMQSKSNIKYKYGITWEEYQNLLLAQNYLCKICKSTETSTIPGTNKPARLCVDHDHLTGKIRGLLCRNCNTAIGKFKENICLLEQAIKYLRGESS